ncbi:hypothetical protein Tco_0167717 [Tanacetum coccineum]
MHINFINTITGNMCALGFRKPAFGYIVIDIVCIAVDTSRETRVRRKDTIGRTIDQSVGGKLRDRNTEESWALLEDLALYDNESWNDPRDSDRRLIELENQVQRLMEAHLAPTQPTQVNKITTSCEICSGLHDTQYCMEDPEQAFVEYAGRLSKFVADFKQQQSDITNKINIELMAITDRITGTLPSDMGDDGEVMFIELIRKNDDSSGREPEEERSTTTERNPIITEGCPSKLKIPCNIGHVHVEKAYIDPNSPLTIMTRMMYNWIMRRKLDPRENSNTGVSNFTGRINGMHVFIGNFTYIVDFMIVKDISSIIDPRLSQVVLEKPFVKISNMTHDPPERVVRFTNANDEVAYKMPQKIEQYNSLSNLEKEHTKSVYLRNEEDKRRGVEYVMNKILGFYKECLELGPEYVTGMDDEGEVT